MLRERNLNILYIKQSSGMILNRCEKNGYPIEVYCRRQFYGPIIIVYSGFHYPHRLRDFCLSDLNKIESINKTNS